ISMKIRFFLLQSLKTAFYLTLFLSAILCFIFVYWELQLHPTTFGCDYERAKPFFSNGRFIVECNKIDMLIYWFIRWLIHSALFLPFFLILTTVYFQTLSIIKYFVKR